MPKYLGMSEDLPSTSINNPPKKQPKEVNDEWAEKNRQDLSYGARNIGRLGVRALESAVGTPGDIGKGVLSLANMGASAIGQGEPFPEKIPYLPTTEQVREGTKKLEKYLPEGIISPQSPGEERADEFVQDLTSLFLPTGVIGKAKLAKAGLALGATAAGHLAKWGAKEVGLSPEAQEGAKIGTMLLTSIAGQPKIRARAEQSLKKSTELMPVGERITSNNIHPILDSMKKSVRHGGETPSKSFLKERISEIQGIIGGTMNRSSGLLSQARGETLSVDDAVQYLRDINELYREGKVPQAASKFMGQTIDALKKSINTLSKSHPEFVKEFNQGNDLYKAINTTSKVGEFLGSAASKGLQMSLPTAYFFGIPKTAGAYGAGKAAEFTANTVNRLIKSPSFRSAYLDVTKNALAANLGATSRSINKFNKIMDYEMEKEPKKSSPKFLGMSS